MTEEQLAAIKARADAATPGPWRLYGETYDEDGNEVPMPYGLERWHGDSGWTDPIWSSGGGEYSHPDAATGAFIAHARKDVPALLAYIEELHADLRLHREERIRLRVENYRLSKEKKR